MILVKFSGGLGNQMFQYALYQRLKQQYSNTVVKADLSIYQVEDLHYGFELNRVFQLIDKGRILVASAQEYKEVTCERPPFGWVKKHPFIEKVWAWTNARTRERAENCGKRNIVLEEPEHTEMTDQIRDERRPGLLRLLDNLDIQKNWYIDGYWQDVTYFIDVMDDVLSDFDFPSHAVEISDAKTAVAIHVRRGDYTNSEYDILPLSYYQKAIQKIKEHAGEQELRYYIFSEDEKYIRDNFAWLGEYTYVNWNTGADSYRDMQLMSKCKYQVVANSSFSTWSGYLNQNEGKLICYPAQYTRTLKTIEKPNDGWYKIELS